MSEHEHKIAITLQVPLFALAGRQRKLDVFRKERAQFESQHLQKLKHFAPLIPVLLGFLEGWWGTNSQHLLSGPGSNVRMLRIPESRAWKLWDSYALTRAFTVIHYPGTLHFQNTIFQYFNPLSCPSSHLLKIPHSKKLWFQLFLNWKQILSL